MGEKVEGCVNRGLGVGERGRETGWRFRDG